MILSIKFHRLSIKKMKKLFIILLVFLAGNYLHGTG